MSSGSRKNIVRSLIMLGLALASTAVGPMASSAVAATAYCANSCSAGFAACGGMGGEGAVCAYVGCWASDTNNWFPYKITCGAQQ